jgi:hypothetical protein
MKLMKKAVLPFLISIFTLLLPVSSAFADSAGWQRLTWESTHWNSTLNAWITGVNNAHASGYVRICNELTSGGSGRLITIKEYDPDNADDVIATNKYLEPQQCLSHYIQPWVDGDNNKAEIYVQLTNNGSYSAFSIWD